MKWIFIVITTTAFMAFNTNAQVYKCEQDGTTVFSQVPCSEDAEEIEVKTIAATTPERTKDEVAQLCLEYLRRSAGWKDPESLRLYSYYTKWESDKSGARHVMVLEIGAKNSYGAYDGSNYKNCFLNHSGTELSTIQRYINN